MADRHIAKCKAQVARQQKIIRQMTLRGQSTSWARDMLGAFEPTLSRPAEKEIVN